eukprot:1177918-Prorocentrum_minimum.AAC.4
MRDSSTSSGVDCKVKGRMSRRTELCSVCMYTFRTFRELWLFICQIPDPNSNPNRTKNGQIGRSQSKGGPSEPRKEENGRKKELSAALSQ